MFGKLGPRKWLPKASLIVSHFQDRLKLLTLTGSCHFKTYFGFPDSCFGFKMKHYSLSLSL